jgi:hypothetical protein
MGTLETIAWGVRVQERENEACNAGCKILEEGSRSERPNSSNII